MIAHKGLIKGVISKIYNNPDQENDAFEKNKEVDEWLMGSGGSVATANSNTNSSVASAKLNS